MARRIALVSVMACLAANACANGAMGLGMEMWDLRYWAAYVVAMVVLEAWLIGKCLRLAWWKSLLVSGAANSVTGWLCGAGGMCAPFLHGSIIGDEVNPSPFLNSVALLAIFALPSALIESTIWLRLRPSGMSEWRLLWRVVWVHLATIPVGLAILLIPERPYLGMEATTSIRRKILLFEAGNALQNYIWTNHKMPDGRTPEAMVASLQPYQTYPDKPILLAFHEPRLTRFATAWDLRYPLEINRSLLGRHIVESSNEERLVWFLRPRFDGSGYQWGLAVDLSSGTVKRMRDTKVLGYTK